MTSENAGPSRRRFIAGTAGIAGGIAAGSLLPPSVHKAMAMPVRPGGLKAIEHVVFLMQENRSFDHYFGTLRGVRGFGDRNAIELPSGKPVFAQPNGAGRVLPFPIREAAKTANKDLQWMGALAHGWPDGHIAHGLGWNNGWVAAKTVSTMAYYDRQDLPFQFELADTFTICDAYHCSVFSSTSPNRNYFVSGYTGTEPDTGRRAIDNAAYSEDTHSGYTWTTYAERLEQAGVSWRVYQERDNFEDNNLEFFATFKKIARKALQGDYQSLDSFYSALGKAGADEQQRMLARLDEGVAKLTAQERRLYERGLHRSAPGTLAEEFRKDVKAGRLPKVSYIVPSAADSEHPGSSSPIQSARLTYDILDAIASDPDTWATTALFITFDENDGLFDHVPPPVPPSAVKDEHVDGLPIGLGFRVPMTVVSPWTVGGYVCSEVFDHTSMLRFVERWIGVEAADISSWRRTVAGDLTSAFDFRAGHRAPQIATPGPVPEFTGRWKPQPPGDQKMPVQEPGTRPARPLPYQPEASARLDGLRLRLRLANTGRSSVHFALYPYAGELLTPRHYDVEGSHEKQDVLTLIGGRYDLVLTGPNGFRREFAGTVLGGTAGAEVSSVPDPRSRQLMITLENTGRSALTFTLKAEAYGSGTREVTVRPGQRGHVPWPTAHGWYDVVVTTAQDKGFRRRLMGHIENGRPSVSG